jgi:UDP-glucose 4-epimerase
MERIFISGVSGYIGQKLLAFLRAKPGVRQIVGIDIKEPSVRPGNFVFYRKDVREPLADILSDHGIDSLVHLAFVVPPLHDKNLMEDINTGGTKNILDACLKAGVKQIVYTSSATAYGFHADNDCPLTEDSPLRGNDDFVYSKTKKEIEGIFSRFSENNPGYTVATLRPSFVAGPVFDNPLARHMQNKLVLLPSVTQHFQYVHEDDLVEIIYLMLQRRVSGVFNVGADGSMAFPEMIKLLGNRMVPLPFDIMYVLNNLAWYLRLAFVSEFPSPALNMVRYPWIVSSDKLKRVLGYRYKYTTRETFLDFAQAFKKAKLRANKRGTLYD